MDVGILLASIVKSERPTKTYEKQGCLKIIHFHIKEAFL